MTKQRVCTGCALEGGSDVFSQNGYRSDGTPRLRSMCRYCERSRENKQPKRCNVCGVEKSAAEFRKNGTYSSCKPCQNEQIAATRRPGGSQHSKHIARQAAYQRRKYKTDPAYRLRVQARKAVQGAVLAGILVRPASCPECGKTCVPHAHHHKGYSREHWLDVVWLCAKCHHQHEGS